MSLLDVVVPGAGSAVQAVTKILTLCQQMKEGQDACTRVHARLQTVLGELQRLEARKQLPPSEAVVVYADVLTRYLQYLERYRAKPLASRLIRHARMMDELRQFHEDVDTLFQLLQLAVAGTVVEWKSQWEVDRQAQKHMLAAVVDNDAMILHELRDLRAQMEAMTLLQFELKRRPTPSAPELDDEPNRDHDTELMRRMFKTVVRTSRGSAPIVPPWFLPPDDVAFDPIPFARGSFATVHRGTWGFGTRVVIKRLLVDDSRAGELLPPRFEKEVSLWHTLNHPNVVKMFGASHVSWPPFIVCEDAVGGNLSSYLTRSPSVKQRSMWRLLYEAALGLDYLHRSRVVHGDLKLNNLLVGADGQAKIADFGLSAVRNTLSTSSTAGAGSRGPQSGGLRWRAPECLRRAPTFASDVYSFAMCLIEAVTDEPPFAFLDDESVRENLRHGDIPDQPDDMPQDAWALVLAMTCFEPKERIPMSRVLSKLKIFAEREAQEWVTVNLSVAEKPEDEFGPRVTHLLPLPPAYYRGEATPTQYEKISSPGEGWKVDKTTSRVKTFLHLLKNGSDQQQVQGVRELLLWLVDTVDERANTELVAQSGVFEVLFDVALRSDNYFDKTSAIGALDLLVDLGYPVADSQVREVKQAVGSAGGLDLSFIIRTLQSGGTTSEKHDILVLCSCLSVISSDNQDLLRHAGVLPFLVAIIQQPTSELAAHAAFALGNLCCRNAASASQLLQAGALDPLLALMSTGLPVARAWAACALGNLASLRDWRRALDTLKALDELLTLLSSGVGLQQQWAAYAVSTLTTGRSFQNEVNRVEAIVPVLTRMAASGSSGQKIWAAAAIGAVAPFVRWQMELTRVADAVTALLTSDVPNQRLRAAYAVRMLVRDAPARISMLISAGVLPNLASAVNMNESDSRLEAICAIGTIASWGPSVCDAIVRTGVTSTLIDIVRDGERDEKLYAASALGHVAAGAGVVSLARMSSPSAIEVLVAVVQDESIQSDTRAEAARTLGAFASFGETTRESIERTGVVAAIQTLAENAKKYSAADKWTSYALKRLRPPRAGIFSWSKSSH